MEGNYTQKLEALKLPTGKSERTAMSAFVQGGERPLARWEKFSKYREAYEGVFGKIDG